MRNDNLTVPESRTSDWKVIEGYYPELTHGAWLNTSDSSAVGDRVDRMEVLRRFRQWALCARIVRGADTGHAYGGTFKNY